MSDRKLSQSMEIPSEEREDIPSVSPASDGAENAAPTQDKQDGGAPPAAVPVKEETKETPADGAPERRIDAVLPDWPEKSDTPRREEKNDAPSAAKEKKSFDPASASPQDMVFDMERIMADFNEMLRWTPPSVGAMRLCDSMPVLTLYPMLKPLPELDYTPVLTLRMGKDGGAGKVPPLQPPREETPPAPPIAADDDADDERVTRHTAALWRYLPVSAAMPEPASEYKSGSAHLPGGHVIAARVRGKKHKHEGTNCDDWYEAAGLEDITVIAVSDGAGSRPYSRIGARESCRAAVGFAAQQMKEMLCADNALRDDLRRELTDERGMAACQRLAQTLQQAMCKAYDAVEAAYYTRLIVPSYSAACGRELHLKDFEATLLLTVIIPTGDEKGTQLVVTCQIGDGMTALLCTGDTFDTSVKLMGTADAGEYTGETEFLLSPRARTAASLQNRTRIYRGTAEIVMMMTDGVADDYFPCEKEMHRLYFDLLVNGILPLPPCSPFNAVKDKEMAHLRETMPQPLVYPWVNDGQLQVAVQYTDRICKAAGLTYEQIWRRPRLLEPARLELGGADAAPDARLRFWLDNYVERGSFDDRTLVLVRLNH